VRVLARAAGPLVLLAGAALAQGDVPRDLPAVPPTQLGLQTLAHSPVVVVARSIAVRPAAQGTDLVTLRVLERMRGDDVPREGELRVLAPQGVMRFGSEDLLFLRPWRGGERLEIVQRVASVEPHFEERLSVVRRTLWLLEERDPQRRADATLDLLVELLASPREWTRGYALAELRWMAQEQRWVFTPGRAARLSAAGRVSPHADVRAGVDSVAAALAPPGSGAPPASRTEQSRP
jgi:hypothetical protein